MIDIKDELKMMIRKAIIMKGSRVRPDGGSYYGGWNDWDMTAQDRGRALRLVTIDDPIRDTEWSEFAGTFDDSRQQYGVEVEIGPKKNREVWRYEGPMGSLITEILS